MKTFFSTFIIFCTSFAALSHPASSIPPPRVDQRVELLSIVFRLAGAEEYVTDNNTSYVKAIHEHFDRYANHPLIAYTKLIRDSSGIGYDRVMSMAVDLDEATLNPIVPFEKQLPGERWHVAEANKFVTLLKQFYKDANCVSFFKSQSARYALAARRFDALIQHFDVGWYNRFYGQPANESFNIIIGLGNGYNNYGPHLDVPHHMRKVYAILGAQTFDDEGNPTFPENSYMPTLIHEFNHSFVNWLGDRYEKQLTASGQNIFRHQRIKMSRLAYGEWKMMCNEALVRAAVVMYLRQHNTDTLEIDREIKTQLAVGFVWMDDLVGLLEQYEKQRKAYPTLENFMPRIVEFYAGVSARIGQYNETYLAKCAKVVSVSPFSEGDQQVNAATSEIVFHFDKPLDGIRYFFGAGKMGREHYPKPLKFTFADGNRSLIMNVELRPDTEYQIAIAGSHMRTSDGYSVQDYVLNFKTTDK